jgi:hypothetical protein
VSKSLFCTKKINAIRCRKQQDKNRQRQKIKKSTPSVLSPVERYECERIPIAAERNGAHSIPKKTEGNVKT